ncbi:hypothetical protein Agub_g12162 [Astrephomene gubernaculifera]|uniref:Heterokaryon incompatibility domain-containing protein n=1 Tax=Astrephomene gubernaculifera TaxID=47775 RepID=A0AAD3HR32_9CHLO|nr:hypothetical protein Agub_g12162 [Astrephomene gubernaculifera]
MPRYLRVADIPAILQELRDGENPTPPVYQLDAWQKKWCAFPQEPEQDAAVLSYRWRIRGRNENIRDFKTWLADCGREGYAVHDLRDGPVEVDWSLADGHAIQIEVAAWLLWLYTNKVATYVWVDQMCVPQDADLEEKMGHIKESPAIYTAGKVYVMIAPVVDYTSGRIMNSQDARAIVRQYNDEMNAHRGAGFLSRSAVKALLVNNSYMRRVWTIQEAVAARNLVVWPLKGSGEVNSYQSIYVVDWPEFNAWNGHPKLGPLYLKYADEALNDYYEGDYTGLLRVLREHPSDGIGYLAMVSKDVMWITMDRNGLINDIKKADSAAKKAFVLLNNHQVQSARSFLAEDRVLALVPLVDYRGWKAATEGVPGRHLVQASVAWAYGIMERQLATWKWSIRVYNAPRCHARGLELLQPRRNLGDSTAMHGATPDWKLEIPPEGGTLTLTPPPPHPDEMVTAALRTWGALEANPLHPKVVASVLMGHPGQAKNWGGGPWTHIRDVLETDEVFRLSVQWALESWRNPDLGVDSEKSAVIVVKGGGLENPAIIILGLTAGEQQPTTGQVMMVVEVCHHKLSALLDGLQLKCMGQLKTPITALSAGIVPPPPPPPEPVVAPAPSEPEWQVVSVPPQEEEPAAPQEAAAAAAEEAAQPQEEEPQKKEAAAATVVDVAAEAVPAGATEVAEQPAVVGAEPAAAEGAAAAEEPAAAAPAAASAPASAAAAAPAPARPASGAAAAPAPARAASAAASGAEVAPDVPPGAAIQKGGVSGVPNSGVEVAAGAKYAGMAPVAQDEGPCKGCVIC